MLLDSVLSQQKLLSLLAYSPCYFTIAHVLQPELRSSLVLSMLQQMLQDDKEADVREAVVRSLGLIIGFVSDKDKYPQVSWGFTCTQ